MKRMLFLAVIAVAGFAVTGCASVSCKKEGCLTFKDGCRTIKPKKSCNDWYCKTIAPKLVDSRVQNGEEVTFEDGITVRTYPKDKITQWDDSDLGQKAIKIEVK